MENVNHCCPCHYHESHHFLGKVLLIIIIITTTTVTVEVIVMIYHTNTIHPLHHCLIHTVVAAVETAVVTFGRGVKVEAEAATRGVRALAAAVIHGAKVEAGVQVLVTVAINGTSI